MKINILFLVGLAACTQIIPEKAEIASLNEKYLFYASMYVTHTRNGSHFLNIEGKIKHTWENNVTLSLVVYEFLHNEYRPTFIGFHMRLCDTINSNPYVGPMVAKTGLTCPVTSGTHSLMNMTFPTGGDMKYLYFLKKCMLRVEFSTSGENMVKGNIYISVTNKKA